MTEFVEGVNTLSLGELPLYPEPKTSLFEIRVPGGERLVHMGQMWVHGLNTHSHPYSRRVETILEDAPVNQISKLITPETLDVYMISQTETGPTFVTKASQHAVLMIDQLPNQVGVTSLDSLTLRVVSPPILGRTSVSNSLIFDAHRGNYDERPPGPVLLGREYNVREPHRSAILKMLSQN
ncbi:MAG: hypothetical protein ABIE03_01220 [Patescibacteria group bacterium]|nr:hypothetical protein [Patescibacteria group bacterium]